MVWTATALLFPQLRLRVVHLLVYLLELENRLIHLENTIYDLLFNLSLTRANYELCWAEALKRQNLVVGLRTAPEFAEVIEEPRETRVRQLRLVDLLNVGSVPR